MCLAADANCKNLKIRVGERRGSKRFQVTKEVFLTFRPDFERIGRVRDISKGGIAFEYLAFRKPSKVKHVEVDIFSRLGNVYISHIPCKVLYDIGKDTLSFLSTAGIRRCGLQFGQLTKNQMARLLTFLR